jgi:hypothetical protein
MSMSSCDAGRPSPGGLHDIKPQVSYSTSAPTRPTTISQEPHMASKAFVVNDEKRERVHYLAGLGVPQDDIAKIIGCAPKTLRKHFRDDLDRGVAEANATIAGYLFAAAKTGNIAAIIFWLKTRQIGESAEPQPTQFQAPMPTRNHMSSWSCPITTEILN